VTNTVSTTIVPTSTKRAPLEPPAPIAAPYLLVSHIPCFQRDGRHLVERLWAKDLDEHLRYLANFTLAAPLKAGEPAPEVLPIGVPGEGYLCRHVDLSCTRTIGQHCLRLPADLVRLWKAIGRSEIVHIGVLGWPIPMGWFAGPMAKLRGKFLVVIIESGDWTIPSTKLRRRLLNAVTGWMAPRLARAADLAIYTQEQYRLDYPPRDPQRGHVIPASWIDREHVLSDQEAAAVWDAKPADSLRLAFFGRLTEHKGISYLIDAMRRLCRDNSAVTLDIYGEGELEPLCRAALGELGGHVRMCGVLPYGPQLFAALRQYHAVVVPGLGTEQPRILYDANSQAVPVLGTATDGNKQVITHGKNGWLTAIGDVDALTSLISQAAHDIPALRQMGLFGLETARGLTHREMHERRWVILHEQLSARRFSKEKLD
jgi:glycosyltransferase involved in cell wall biosynthesis